MSIFDLSNAATGLGVSALSPIAGLLQRFLGDDVAKWDLLEGTYLSNATKQKNPKAVPVPFLLFAPKNGYQVASSEITDIGGRRKVKITFPYRDGQTTDDLGRLADDFDILCMYFGPSYRDGYTALLAELNQPTPGIMVHPIRGNIPVAFQAIQSMHREDARKAVLMRLRFIEHTFTVDDTTFKSPAKPSAFKSALLGALGAIKKIDSFLNIVRANTFAALTIKNTVVAAVAGFKTALSLATQQFNITFNKGGSVDIPSVLPVVNGGLANANGTLSSTNFPVVTSLNDPFNPVAQVNQQTNLVQPLSPAQAVAVAASVRTQAQALINLVRAIDNGQGALEYYNELLDVESAAIEIQKVLEVGLATSSPAVLQFTTPRLMSVREVAFEVGISVDRSIDIEILNPQLLSVNWIPEGTVLQVPAR